MTNLKKIVDEINDLNKTNFESFISEQILSAKSSFNNEPCFSFYNKDFTIDVWKHNDDFDVIKSIISSSKKQTNKDFKKKMKKEDVIKTIQKVIDEILD
ncbi:MAG: hypothetical protein PHF86_07290 [Candidatus Nanoarchaeia archaeon]|jgi:hypothetical protein|nr:hypothetical protein [Candidatus Nanoarchaeia archaeon]